MRYPASEKLEIIRLVEQSHLPVRRTLEQIGIPRSTFYRWYDLYQSGGPDALEDRSPSPGRVWNRIPDNVRNRIIQSALEEPELSPRELAVSFTDTQRYFVSEPSVYRLLKAHDLITSPAFVVMKAADEFRDKTTAPNQLWQTDFTYLKVIGWGWFYLSTKPRCCPRTPQRKIPRDVNEAARDKARALAGTPAFEQSRNERKKVEMLFAHLKRNMGFERLRLRGICGARDEFLLAAIAQNLRRLAKLAAIPPPDPRPA